MCFESIFNVYSNVFVQLHAVGRTSVSNIMSQGFRNFVAPTLAPTQGESQPSFIVYPTQLSC